MILPAIIVVLNPILFFLERKKFLEILQEFREQKFVKDFVLNHFWNLIKKLNIFVLTESLILIILPFVFKMALDPSFEVKLNGILLIELLNYPKELG